MTDDTAQMSALMVAIEDRRDDLIQLTGDLIRIPTLNPPGENYQAICDFLAKRLKASGFDIELVRAFETPGDSERYPRWNVIARREGKPVSYTHLTLPTIYSV